MTDSPRFRTLYLHIGLGKTGTTSIQHELAARAEPLASRCGLHFPTQLSHWTQFRGNHSNLLRARFAEAPRPRRRLATLGLRTDQDIDTYNAINQRDLLAGFAASPARNLMLSAEVVSHFEPVDLGALASWCRELASEVVVVACIRHPVHALASEIQQRLRIGAKLENLYRNPPRYRLRELFERLADAFGRPSLRAYSFHRAVEHPRGLAAALDLVAQQAADDIAWLAENFSLSLEHPPVSAGDPTPLFSDESLRAIALAVAHPQRKPAPR